MEREYRDGKMLTIGESKWKGIGGFIVLFFSVGLGLSNIQCWERGTRWGISQERAWCFGQSEVPMRLGPCSPSWHYLALRPILIPAWSPQVCPPGSCRPPSLLRMTTKVNPIPHHLPWPLLIFFFIVFSFLSLLCPELHDVNVALLSVLLTEVHLVHGQTGIWQLFIPLWVLSFGPLRLL